MPALAGRADQAVESGQIAQLRMDRRVTADRATDRPRDARIGRVR